VARPKKSDALDADAVISAIREGKTQTEVAKESGLSVSRLNEWLHSDPERSARAREAMEASAEAWLDRGHAYLVDALPDNAEIARARALEQHCARRAAIRNPKRYGDKIEQTIEVGEKLEKIVRTVVDPAKS
jgi:transcriptional regulator with XRE-family HTH domain